MKAVQFGQKFICFSFVIEDGKRVVNIFEVCWEASAFEKITLVLTYYREDLNCRVRISAGQGFKRKAVYTEGVGPVCKCTGQCTLQGSVQVYFNF